MIQMLNSAAAEWGELFLLAVIQNTVFLGLVFAALYFLRNAPARVRYLVALAGLIKLVLPPFMRISANVSIPGASRAGYGRLIPFVTGSENGSAVMTSKASETAGESLTAAGALLGIWALVLLAGLIYTIAGSIRLALRLRGARPVTEGELPAGIRLEGTSIFLSRKIAMPITVAFLPGRIFVPSAWDGWTPRCRRMVLRHEMAHLKRYDGIVLIMQIIARAIYFFHPLVAMLDRRLSEYREMACDDATVGWDRNSSVEYSRYLVEIAESVVRCPAVCGSASALIRRKNELLARIKYQLEEERMRSISKTRVMTLAAAVVLLAVSLSWYRGDASTGGNYPEPPKPSQEERVCAIRQVKVLLKSGGVVIGEGSSELHELKKEVLKEEFGKIYVDPGDIVIQLICDDDVSMSDVRIFQETLVELRISKIEYINGDGDALPLALPPQEAIEMLETLPGNLIIDVAMGDKGGIFVGTRDLDVEQLSEVLSEKLTEEPTGIVVIHGDAMSYGDFTKVLELIQKAGAERIIMKFDGGE